MMNNAVAVVGGTTIDVLQRLEGWDEAVAALRALADSRAAQIGLAAARDAGIRPVELDQLLWWGP